MAASKSLRSRTRRCTVLLEGCVQGVGFRPAVRRLAVRHQLTGSVRNTMQGLLVDVEGDEAALVRFLDGLADASPAGGVAPMPCVTWHEPRGTRRFTIDVGPGRNDVPVRLEEGLALEGAVFDGDGMPLRGILVSFDDACTWTDEEGAFRLRGLPDEAGTLDISGDDHSTLSLTARPGRAPLRRFRLI